jgi:hypothetical protein
LSIVANILRKVPLVDRPGTLTLPGGIAVSIKSDQRIVWASVTPSGLADFPAAAPRFPVVLDTGFNHTFLMAERQLEDWTALKSDLLRHHLQTTRFNLKREVPLDSRSVRPDHDLVARGPGAADLCMDDTVWEGLVNGLDADEVVMLFALRQGFTPREVGAQLGVSVRTIERFRGMLATKARRQWPALA